MGEVETQSGMRDKILDAAYDIFAEQGYGKASLNQIAKKLGVTRPALYYHFKSKDDLFAATYNRIDLLADVDTADALSCASADGFPDQLEALVRRIIGNLHKDEQRSRFVAAVESASHQSAAVRESVQQQNTALHKAFSEVVAHGVALGAFRDDTNVAEVAEYLCVIIRGTSEELLIGSAVDTEAIVRRTVASVFA